MHSMRPVRHLPAAFRPPAKLPLTVGKVHFIRAVSQERQIMVLNQHWVVPSAKPDQGVWATLQFSVQGARLRIYDAAPDAQRRTCLAEYPFPLKEPVQPLRPEFYRQGRGPKPSWAVTTLGWIGRAVSQWVSTML